jgi:hypothetical protein
MNRRLKVISIILGFVYLFVIGDFLYSEFRPIIITAVHKNSAKVEKEHKLYLVYAVKPKDKLFSMPSRIQNIKTGQTVQAEFSIIKAVIVNPQLPSWHWMFNAVSFLGIFLIAALIYFPIQIYKIAHSIVKNDVFQMKNVKRLRRIGYALLFIFGYISVYGYMTIALTRGLIQMEGYNIVFKMTDTYSFLIFGIATLLFAEILQISHKMKEENDLTI